MEDLWTRLSRMQPQCERQSHYGQLWNLGMNSLKDAQETPDKSLYLQAGYAFIKAIRAIAGQPEAWLGLSYLLYLLGDEASALFYAEQVLEQSPHLTEAQELHELLYSSRQISLLMANVTELQTGQDWVERPPERLSDSETDELLHQAQAVLQIQHLLLRYEIDQGRFVQLEVLRRRQQDLESLCQLLREQLQYFLVDPRWGPVFQGLFAQLEADMLALRQLELLFEAMLAFQKEVQGLFVELTRRTLRLRVQGRHELEDNQRYLFELFQRLEQLSHKLSSWPANLRIQAENSSGWPHMLQQTRQFQSQLMALAAQEAS